MTVTAEDLRLELVAAFARACRELAGARRRQIKKDTPSSRIALQECRARIDGILDLYLDMNRAA